jgi:uncharacterized MnhB-related membrane protein
MTTLLFVLLFGLAVGSAIAMVAQRNPLYSAISLIGVFIALAGLYLMLAAPFLAAIQIIVYAGAIMVLVVFVIMLLNVEEEEPRKPDAVAQDSGGVAGRASVCGGRVHSLLCRRFGRRAFRPECGGQPLECRFKRLHRHWSVHHLPVALRDHLHPAADGDCRRDDARAPRRFAPDRCGNSRLAGPDSPDD